MVGDNTTSWAIKEEDANSEHTYEIDFELYEFDKN